MRKIWLKLISICLVTVVLLSGCGSTVSSSSGTAAGSTVGSSAASSTATREITDAAGRKLTIPTEVKKAYAVSQIGIIALYSLCPDKLAGWGFALTDNEKKYVPEKYFGLPVLGVWSGKNGTGNVEEIIKLHPDVMISMGTLTDSDKSTAEKLQTQLGIPVIMLDGSLDKMDQAYAFLGDIMGEKDKAKELGDYCKAAVSDVKTAIQSIPQDKRVKVYYAEGPKGLETDPSGSFHTEVLDLVGGINVAQVPAQKGFGRAAVSLEQLLKWNPDVVIAGYDKDAGNGFFDKIMADPGWKNIKAIKEKRVYGIPAYPFDWFDRPPSANRIIGVKWLANLLYPDAVKLDISAEVKTFYDKFYHKTLSDQETADLLKYTK